jgi:ribonuclease PH
MTNNTPTRIDERKPDELRPVAFNLNYIEHPEGSVLVEMGKTRVLCNATVEEIVPNWMRNSGRGWLTAEYAMLPRSTHTRSPRERKGLKGRTQEIQRLIGRSLRMAVDLDAIGERTILVDCDVLQADGGTRTASITGGYVAAALAIQKLVKAGKIPADALKQPVAAVSAGLVDGVPLLDLCYEEDVRAEVDLNVVLTSEGRLIEVQATAERAPIDRQTFNTLLDLAAHGAERLTCLQIETLKG